ncbi:MAG: ABC transporter ATP-binding protein [Sphingomonadales bacterium]|nr:ABC transporter ATP-binding protein [Sphingomonadales bacterium]
MRSYARIFSYLTAYKARIALYFIFILLSILFSIVSIGMLMPFLQLIFTGKEALPPISGNNYILYSVNHFLQQRVEQEGQLAALAIICWLMILLIAAKNLFLYLAYYTLNPIKHQLVNQLREDLYDKVLQLPIGYFNEKRKGDLMSRMTNDVNEVEVSVIGALEGWIRDPLNIVLTLVFLFTISMPLTLFILILIPVLGLVIGRITRSLKKISNEVAQKFGETLGVLDETLGGLRVIKAFGVESSLREKFKQGNDRLRIARNRIGYRRDLASPLSEVMGVALFTAVLYYGGKLVLQEQLLEASVFIGFLGIFYNMINPAKALSTSFSNMRKGSAAIGRLEEILHAPITVEEVANAVTLTEFTHSIEFKNVRFSYGDVLILDGIDLVIPKGKTIALVGASGSGKSTLADLVPRFHDVSAGEVLIDGINIKNCSLRSLRSLMSIVTQEPIVFNDTIAANIALGQPHATDEEIAKAARIANAHSFILEKEEGYQTNIGDRGTKLSGGERQRLTIARALLKNPPILILDEATSSLDTESERLVQDAINKMMQQRTSIVIAHRLSTIRHADEIIVLQKGKIAERGKHEELIAQNGIYKKLVEWQAVR